jgi:hypothetical protein
MRLKGGIRRSEIEGKLEEDRWDTAWTSRGKPRGGARGVKGKLDGNRWEIEGDGRGGAWEASGKLEGNQGRTDGKSTGNYGDNK